jgi:ferritin-like metal-binding protein YciE
MPVTELKEVLTHELGDLLYAERRILTMLKTMGREVSDPAIKQRIEEHQGETEGQIERLKEAFESIGEPAKAEKCEAAIGLKEEHDSFKSEEKPTKPMLEAFDLGSGLRVEHYEIAAYRTAIAIATALGENRCAGILQESLLEEEEMAKFLEKNALRTLKVLAKKGQEENEKKEGKKS